eukprot:TRINITY_DN12832_c0_g2_i1.p1 TRINITY_DN12832_c0_g2~~TRINITY_DN12832_c0_g2_i1.p1  ORF type:complete len:552 (-),score=49.18 TRINITY_DN12832_c0_g2_i1:255-1868(-)
MSAERLPRASKKFSLPMPMPKLPMSKSVTGGLTDDYFRRQRKEQVYEGMRGKVRAVLNHVGFDIAVGLLLLINFACVCIETDSRAENTSTPVWVSVFTHLCFVMFCLEWLCHAYVERHRVFFSISSNLDLAIVASGIFEYILALFLREHGGSSSSGWFRLLRILRLLRLLRVIKLFSVLKELKKLLQMLASCAKTLFWSFLLCLILSSIWSVVAVEYLHHVAVAIDAVGGFGDCDRCGRAFQTVMGANLTLFQIVVAGDSWGALAIPMIEYNPATALIFVGALVSLVYGVLNLVLAVVVDTYADMKKNDMSMLADELVEAELNERNELAGVFRFMDRDMDETLSLKELLDGAECSNVFQDWLRVLDIGASDLQCLFEVIDADMSGCVSIEEFTTMMYRMRHGDNKTSIRLTKCMLQRLELTALRIEEDLKSMTNHLQRGTQFTGSHSLPQVFESTPCFNDGIASCPSAGAELTEHPLNKSARSGETGSTTIDSGGSIRDQGQSPNLVDEEISAKTKKKAKAPKKKGAKESLDQVHEE